MSALAIAVALPALPAAAEPAPSTTPPPGATRAGTPAAPPTDPPVVAADQRDRLLGQGWQRSGDRLWTTSGDSTGLHVLVAEARTGYAWRVAATLSVPGVEADSWIGNACVTASGNRAVVVYAPRSYSNEAALTARGGFTAIVDLTSGVAAHLAVRTSLAYYNPGCGAGETVALTQEGDEDLGRTGVLLVDTATGKVGRRTELAGQVTSATPVPGGFVVADRLGLLRVPTSGKPTRLVAGTAGVPFDVRADSGGGVVFSDLAKDTMRLFRATPAAQGRKAAVSQFASAPAGRAAVTAGTGGRLFLTGQPILVGALPSTITKLATPAAGQVSSLGEAVLTDQVPVPVADPTAARPVHLLAVSTRTGHQIGFTVDPATTLTPRWTPGTTDPARVCSVPRNDPTVQVYQPRPKEVEWAVDWAVKGILTPTRPANWHNNGIGSYTPQGMFPPEVLSGGGQVPAQILLGILGQESNLWEAAKYALPGEYSNPLVGNYYGLATTDGDPNNDWDIDWDKADCGYGVGQITDGMRLPGHPRPGSSDTPLPHDQQVAIATDYAANVAAALRILQSKWNEMSLAGMTVNNGNPARIENWFYAVWAYNSGFHDQGEAGSNGAYGLGWLNNPANPRYAADRHNFGSNPHDYAAPQGWPYEEKVLGFASNPPSILEAPGTVVPFFRAAFWNGKDGDASVPGSAEAHKKAAFPPHNLFCSAFNNCAYGTLNTPTAPDVVGEPAGPCQHTNTAGQIDLKCWWHSTTLWQEDCDTVCGHEFIRYDPGVNPTISTTSYPPACNTAGLGTRAQAVDDLPDSAVPVEQFDCRSGLGASFGSFDLAFAHDANGLEPSKIDLHQMGGGYGSHYWFSHTLQDDVLAERLRIDGTWTFNAIDGLARVRVHLPAHSTSNVPGGAVTQGSPVQYVIDTSNGQQSVVVDQNASQNTWVDLGIFPFDGQPKVHLSTVQPIGNGDQKVIWDAAAIEPAVGGAGYSAALENSGSDPNLRLCLMLRGNSNLNSVVEQRPCNQWNANYWTFNKIADVPNAGIASSYYQVQDRMSGHCLGVAGRSTAAGAAVIEVQCDSTDDSQIWQLETGDTVPSTEDTLLNKHSGMLAGPANSATSIGATMTQRPMAVNGSGNPTDDTQFWFKQMVNS